MRSSAPLQTPPSPGSAILESLSDLVGDVDRFQRDMFGRRDGVSHNDAATELLSSEEIWNELDCGGLVAPYFGIIDGTTRATVDGVTETRLVQTRPRQGYANAAAVRDKVISGSILKLNQPEHWHRAIHRLVAGLTRELRSEVKSCAYLSSYGSSGIPAHHDDAHVMVVQLEGQMAWTVGRATACTHITLQPGDILYIPQRRKHRGVPETQGSLHLAITIQPPTVRDVAELALTRFLRSSQAAEISGNHQLMSVEEKIEWLRTTLCSYLSTQDPGELAKAASRNRQQKGQA